MFSKYFTSFLYRTQVIKAILNPVGHPGDEQCWIKSALDLFPLVSELHEVLREGCGKAQYKQCLSSLKNSILTAFYTPPEIVNTLAEALKIQGIVPIRLLDPSAGMGAFTFSYSNQFPGCEITSQRVLNTEQNSPMREWLMQHCEPVSAVRLPNTFF